MKRSRSTYIAIAVALVATVVLFWVTTDTPLERQIFEAEAVDLDS